MEPFSQSLSMFLLDALLSTGNDSMEHTDSALDNTVISQPNDTSRLEDIVLRIQQEVSPL